MEDGEYANWIELPAELTSSILLRIGAIEMLENAQKVCRYWRDVCRAPFMWSKIDMQNDGCLARMGYDLEVMCRHAFARSQGGLVEMALWYFATDALMSHIANRPNTLRRLNLVMCYSITDEGFIRAVVKLPLLEELELSYCPVSEVSLKVAGQSCPNLNTLKLNCAGYRRPRHESDVEALAIAETMPKLGHLQIFGNRLTNTGLKAILDKCPRLEHLDLRQCFNLYLVGALERQCLRMIKVVKRPGDSTQDYPYDAAAMAMDTEMMVWLDSDDDEDED